MLESSDQVDPLAAEIRLKRRIKCSSYVAAILLLQTAVTLTLAFTVFKLKSPTVRVGKVTIDKLQLFNGGNMTLNADVWVKNPNFASFYYGDMRSSLFYRSAVIGEWRGSPGMAKAHRTARINVTVDIMTDRVLTMPGLDADIYSGMANVSSCTRIGGKLKLFVMEKQIAVRINCNMTLNITSERIQGHQCKPRITF